MEVLPLLLQPCPLMGCYWPVGGRHVYADQAKWRRTICGMLTTYIYYYYYYLLLFVKRRLFRDVNSRWVNLTTATAKCPLTHKKEVVPAEMDKGNTADRLTYSSCACPISQGHAI